MFKTLQAWLGLSETPDLADPAPLGELLEALDRLDPSRAQFLARFAFLLGRVARADEQISGKKRAPWRSC